MKHKKVRVYVQGRGFVDIAKTVFEKITGNSAVQNFVKSAITKAAETGGSKLGEYAANKVAEKVIPQNKTITALEELENKVRNDIMSYQTGAGFKVIR